MGRFIKIFCAGAAIALSLNMAPVSAAAQDSTSVQAQDAAEQGSDQSRYEDVMRWTHAHGGQF